MFQICKNFIKVNDELFQVVRTFPEERVKDFNLVKEWLGAESVFKRDGSLYFCIKIIDLEVVN
jgi:hypothetical protein